MTDPVKRVQAEALTDEQIGAWCAEAQGKTFGVIPQARYVIAKALAALPEAPAVPVVKALEWRENVSMPHVWHADRYIIRVDRGEPDLYIVSGWNSGTNPYETLDAAKAAAQADFEDRIRSALVATPPAPTAGKFTTNWNGGFDEQGYAEWLDRQPAPTAAVDGPTDWLWWLHQQTDATGSIPKRNFKFISSTIRAALSKALSPGTADIPEGIVDAALAAYAKSAGIEGTYVVHQDWLRPAIRAALEAARPSPNDGKATCPSCGGNGVNPEGLMRPDGSLADCEICNGRGTVRNDGEAKP